MDEFLKKHKKHLGPGIALAVGVVFIGALMANAPSCKSEPTPPPPCKDVKLSVLTTQTCPHPDHILENNLLKASVCRCKDNIPKEKKWVNPWKGMWKDWTPRGF